ncbi:MAG: hypothetical protein ACYC27_16345 [Armatimonadota bacterium]
MSGILGWNLRCVVLFGSAVLGDFRHGKGDLDFMAITNEDLGADDCEKIFCLHDSMRTGAMGQLSAQLEGTYYPISIVQSPSNASAAGCYVGTGRKGWRQVSSSCNSASDYAIICRYGVFYGEDIRHMVYSPSDSELTEAFLRSLNDNIENAPGRKSIEYALAMYHWAARGLCHAMTGQLLSKRDAATWFASASLDPEWTELVLHTERYRHPLTAKDLDEIDPRTSVLLVEFLSYIRGLVERYSTTRETGSSY